MANTQKFCFFSCCTISFSLANYMSVKAQWKTQPQAQHSEGILERSCSYEKWALSFYNTALKGALQQFSKSSSNGLSKRVYCFVNLLLRKNFESIKLEWR